MAHWNAGQQDDRVRPVYTSTTVSTAAGASASAARAAVTKKQQEEEEFLALLRSEASQEASKLHGAKIGPMVCSCHDDENGLRIMVTAWGGNFEAWAWGRALRGSFPGHDNFRVWSQACDLLRERLAPVQAPIKPVY